MSYGLDRAYGIVKNFLSSFVGVIESAVSKEVFFLQSLILSSFSSFSSSFGTYGIFIPTVLAASVGITIMGGYLVFVFFSGLNVVAGDV